MDKREKRKAQTQNDRDKRQQMIGLWNKPMALQIKLCKRALNGDVLSETQAKEVHAHLSILMKKCGKEHTNLQMIGWEDEPMAFVAALRDGT